MAAEAQTGPLHSVTHLFRQCTRQRPVGPDGLDLLAILDAGAASPGGGPAVIVDEAYIEFDGQSLVELRDRYPALIVVRTLSKAFAMTGLRVGYAVAARSTVERLERVRPPGSLNTLSAKAAARALRRQLEAYDREQGVWRGTGERLDTALLSDEEAWRAALAESARLRRFAPVMMAGFSAGFGIAGMLVVAEVLLDKVRERMSRLVVGDSLDKGVDIGAVVAVRPRAGREALRQRLLNQKHNAAVDEMETLAADFNAQVRAYDGEPYEFRFVIPRELVETVATADVGAALASGDASGGMRPKLAAALEALQAGVAEVVLADGRAPHALTAALLGAGPATRISAGGRT